MNLLVLSHEDVKQEEGGPGVLGAFEEDPEIYREKRDEKPTHH